MTVIARLARAPRNALLAATVFVLAACSMYPLGMSEKEWLALTPEQQMAARMKQGEIDKANAEKRARQAEVRRQRHAAIEAMERRRVEELYRSDRYGDVLECVVEGGVADFRPGWRPYAPTPFTLARGEVKSIEVRGADRRGKFWARYSPDGLSMKLCFRKPDGYASRLCATIGGQSQRFSSGVSRQVSVGNVFKNARVVCAHRPERGMPRAYILRHDRRVYRTIHRHHYRNRARRTPYVIHRSYDRPVRPRRTVIHKHYYQPAPRPAPKVIHKHYHQAPAPPRAERRDHVAPGRPPEGRNRGPIKYKRRPRPSLVDPKLIERLRRERAPEPSAPETAPPQRVAKPRDAGQRENARPARNKKSDEKLRPDAREKKDRTDRVGEKPTR